MNMIAVKNSESYQEHIKSFLKCMTGIVDRTDSDGVFSNNYVIGQQNLLRYCKIWFDLNEEEAENE